MNNPTITTDSIIAALSKAKKKLRTIWTPDPEQEQAFFDSANEEENELNPLEEELWEHSTQRNK